MARPWLLALAFLGIVGFTNGLVGCSPSMTREERQAYEERQSIERPARAIDEEESIFDDIGKVGVVILIVGITVVGILLPILLI